MPNLFFPQLSTGAIAQYPIKKMLVTRSITNLLADGSMILQTDPGASKVLWEMAFNDLSSVDSNALLTHFQACYGPFHAFTFIDPTDNMLAYSSDLTASSWVTSPAIQIGTGASDPTGSTGAFVITNAGSAPQQLYQELNVPGGYQYCFSLYAVSAQPASIAAFRQGATATAVDDLSVTTNWTRFVSSGRLNDAGTQLSVGLTLAPGQEVSVYGLQLEAQIQPSRYRSTAGSGGVYANCHWTSNSLPISSGAPNLFSTAFTIQTNL